MSRIRQYAPAVVTLLIVLAVGATVIGADDIDRDEAQRTIEEARAYCYQTHSDPTLYNAMVVGNHGGLHCHANGGGEPHLHDVTVEAKRAAYIANQTGEAVDWSTVDRYKPAIERGWTPTILTGGSALLLAALIGVAVHIVSGRVR